VADPISGQGVGARPKKRPFTLYAAGGRVYAKNVAYSIVDLGSLAQQGDDWCYRLDGNQLSAAGFASPEEALQDIARRLQFLWLDGQFTALPDVKDDVDLAGAAKLEFSLDELGPGERMEDAAV